MEAGTRVGYVDQLIGLRIGVVDKPGEFEHGVRFGETHALVEHDLLLAVADDVAHDRALAAAWAGIALNDDLGHRLLGTERVSGVDVSVYVKDGQLYLAGNGAANLRRVSGA